MKNSSGFVHLLLILFLTIAILVGGFFILSNRNELKAPIEENQGAGACAMDAKLCADGSYVARSGPNCEFAQCPSSSSDSMPGWRTYSNSEAGFRFEYPSFFPELLLDSKLSSQEMKRYTYDTTYSDSQHKNPDQDFILKLSVGGPEPNPLTGTLMEWMEGSGYSGSVYDPNYVRPYKEITLNGHDAILQTGSFKTKTNPTDYTVFFSVGKDVYSMSLQMPTNNTDFNTYKNLFDQILSTFKFTN